MKTRVYSLGALNLAVNPLSVADGELLRCNNVDRVGVNAWEKRLGYTTYLGVPDGNTINDLFNWTRNNGTQFWNYRYSGSILYYSTQGTGDWTVCGNGTFTDGGHIGQAVLEDTMIVGDGVTATRHTTDGTSFTNTISAPIAGYFTEYQNRIYAGGTASSLFYSTTGTPSDWVSDSSSISIPGAGKIQSVFKSANRLITTKNSGLIFRYDGDNLIDLTTQLGPTSPVSIANIEDFRVWGNRLGIFGFGGDNPELISKPIESLLFNRSDSAIQPSTFDTFNAETYRYDYWLSVGDTIEDIYRRSYVNTIILYDFQLNEFRTYTLRNKPTAMLMYRAASGELRFIFGSTNGQCYAYGLDENSLTDQENAVTATMEGILHLNSPETDKKFNYLWAFGSPGSQCHIQVAIADTINQNNLRWVDIGSLQDGMAEFRFPTGSRGKLLYWKLTDTSTNARFRFYGFTIDWEAIER